MSTYVAVDLGAESGRVVTGRLEDGGQVRLQEVERFANLPVRTPDGLHWNLLGLYTSILSGLRKVCIAAGDDVVGVGVDSWAVDYGLLDAAGRLLGQPYHYRDARTDGVCDVVAQIVSPTAQYGRTGIAQLPFNTLYQLVAQTRSGDGALELAQTLLMIPDLLHYWLCGERSTEYTNATSTGMLGADGTWASDLLDPLGVSAHVLLTPSLPGTKLATLRRDVREESGLGPVHVFLPATHDTASAVAAAPLVGDDDGAHAYISSGTWSLLGLELDHAIVSEEARLAGFTNEGGVGGTYRFLTNIMGLWLVQESRRAWARTGREWSYDALTAGAAARPSPDVVIDVDDPALLHPTDMPAAIAAQLRCTGQDATVAADPIALVRAILDGLALAYRAALERAEHLAGVRVGTLHIVGGGARNALLCQLTADACRRPVLAGPVEATAFGNVLAQALGAGELRDWAELRRVVQRSVALTPYEPRGAGDWDERAHRLATLRAAR